MKLETRTSMDIFMQVKDLKRNKTPYLKDLLDLEEINESEIMENTEMIGRQNRIAFTLNGAYEEKFNALLHIKNCNKIELVNHLIIKDLYTREYPIIEKYL